MINQLNYVKVLKPLKHISLLIVLTIFYCSPTSSIYTHYEENEFPQTDTLRVSATQIPPVIDGNLNDQSWSIAEWSKIDHTWVPWGGSVDSTDYYGRFKCVWSPITNLLYFIVEITDDIFVDGYVYDSIPGEHNRYPDHDIVEVFIDENNSGGINIFDGNSKELGFNGENAFTYHIAANEPARGMITYEKIACDIAGTSWSDYYIPNYEDHLPEFSLYKNDCHYTWEFSMKVYNDTYDPDNPEAALAILQFGKIMGISLAYCDNDTPGTKRDNFFGTVHVKETRYNDHWKDADDFGVIKLIGNSTKTIDSEIFH